MNLKRDSEQSEALKSGAILFGLISEFRGVVPLEEASEVIIGSAYLFWQDPEKMIDALESGENKLQQILFNACQTLCKTRSLPLKAEYYLNMTCSGLIESYRQIYQQCDNNRLNFAHFIAEGFFTGTILEHRHHLGDLDSGSVPYLMRNIARLYPHQTVYDGACGFGRLLYLLNPPSFVARDIAPINVALSQLLFEMLARKGRFQVGDTLMAQALPATNFTASDSTISNSTISDATTPDSTISDLAKAGDAPSHSLGVDMVISQPPFGIQIDAKALAKVPYLLIKDPISSRASDSLWIQEALYQTHESGRVILHIAPGWSYRAGYDLALRKALLEHNWVEAMIYLPGEMMNYTGIESNILILNRAKTVNTVRLINGKSLGFFSAKQRCRILSEADIQTIIESLQTEVSSAQNPALMQEIPLSEIRKKGYDLSENLYFLKTLTLELESVAEAKAKLQKQRDRCQKLQAEFEALLASITSKIE